MEDKQLNKPHEPILPFDQIPGIRPRNFEPVRQPMVFDDITEVIGNTPLVRLNRIPHIHGLECDIFAKCEYLNPAGSLKDRIAKRMIEEAEIDGRLKPGGTIIEGSSGNTGIGLAFVSAVKGYNCIVVMTDKMSKEKQVTVNALGCNVKRTPTGKRFYDKDHNEAVAKRLASQMDNAVNLDQYANPYNPLCHYDGTGAEIMYDCQGNLDMVVAGSGTGGTLTGISRKIKEQLPNCKVIGVDAVGSVVAEHTKLDEFEYFEIEGIGHDYKPTAMCYNDVDDWIKVDDKRSFKMARDLIKLEGLLVGGSSGTVLCGAIDACKKYGLGKGQRCVVILADSIRNYMTKFLDDEWMTRKQYL